MTTTLALSNLKGGVAKTTTCLSLGACLAEMGNASLVTVSRECAVFGQPVTLYAPNTRGTAQNRVLAQELITHG